MAGGEQGNHRPLGGVGGGVGWRGCGEDDVATPPYWFPFPFPASCFPPRPAPTATATSTTTTSTLSRFPSPRQSTVGPPSFSYSSRPTHRPPLPFFGVLGVVSASFRRRLVDVASPLASLSVSMWFSWRIAEPRTDPSADDVIRKRCRITNRLVHGLRNDWPKSNRNPVSHWLPVFWWRHYGMIPFPWDSLSDKNKQRAFLWLAADQVRTNPRSGNVLMTSSWPDPESTDLFVRDARFPGPFSRNSVNRYDYLWIDFVGQPRRSCFFLFISRPFLATITFSSLSFGADDSFASRQFLGFISV